MRPGPKFRSCSIRIKAGLSLCESSIILDWIISLERVGGQSINKSLWMERGTDEFPSVVFVTPALYCKTEMILFPWQLCVNVLCAVFLHFMPTACSVYHCLLSDWGYCTVSLLSISCLSAGRRWSPVGGSVEACYRCTDWSAGISTLMTHMKVKIIPNFYNSTSGPI